MAAIVVLGAGVGCDSAPELVEPPRLAVLGAPTGFLSGTVSGGGSWSYRWNSETERYALTVRAAGRSFTDLWCQENPGLPVCGGISGFSGFVGAFVHILMMNEAFGGLNRTVVVFAWGTPSVFEAAVLPNTPESLSLMRDAFGRPTSEVVELIRTVVSQADDVIRGDTQTSMY